MNISIDISIKELEVELPPDTLIIDISDNVIEVEVPDE